MSIEATVAADVAEFVRREVEEVLEQNGPDEYMFSISVWAVLSGRTDNWTIYDGFGPEHDAEVANIA